MTLDLLLANAAVVAGLMLLVWLVSLPLANVAIIDVAWGLGFVLVAWTSQLVTASAGTTARVLVVLVSIWGLRLALHLARRNIGAEEDARYRSIRSSWPWFPLTSLVVVFALQGVLMLVVALPLMAGIASPRVGWSVGHVFGIGLWTIGFLFEAVGDAQLVRFKSRPENDGRVLDRGLWRYTRHPNYFGDLVVWWGYFTIAIAGGAAWWTIVGPIVMSILLLRVSGVTLLEKGLRERKPEYAAYVARTSPFLPWPPSDASPSDEEG